MRENFNRDLDLLNDYLLEMGELVVKNIIASIKALSTNDLDAAKRVIEEDIHINNLEKVIESLCFSLILKQQPVASDFRLVTSALKMVTDLERIGDQAADIAEITLDLKLDDYIKPLLDVPKMAEITVSMVKDSIDSFTDGNLSLAKTVIGRDDQVDELFENVKVELIDLIHKDPSIGDAALNFLMISKHLEKIGDHAENLAEWVIYAITGVNPKLDKPS